MPGTVLGFQKWATCSLFLSELAVLVGYGCEIRTVQYGVIEGSNQGLSRHGGSLYCLLCRGVERKGLAGSGLERVRDLMKR